MVLYEINTRCWLHELTGMHGHPVTLADVPEEVFEQWGRLGITHLWLMGVWTTGPLGRAQALCSRGLRQAYAAALPDWREEDVVGSPYAIADYQIPLPLGGEEGLKQFRAKLNARGIKLLLDFVPNHVGLDHRWAAQQPDLFVQDSNQAPGVFAQQTDAGVRWLAHGKDPSFGPWTDTIQLDYRRAGTRAAMIELLLSVADRCDGVRCDMAMLVLSDVFARSWENYPMHNGQASAGQSSPPEFWSEAIAAVKRAHPQFLFLAEAYWGMEPRLQSLGFDFTYDKALFDKLGAQDGAGVQEHLFRLAPEVLAAGAHFLENHDEPRIAAALSPSEQRPAALLILSLPGLPFLHEGQLSGARRRLPVQLARRAAEPKEPEVERLYEQLLTTLPATAVGRGTGRLLRPRTAWAGNPTAQNIQLVQWQASPPDFDLVAVNLAPHRSQCYAPLVIPELALRPWLMKDLLGPEQYRRLGEDLQNQGLYLDLAPHAAQLFHFQPDQ